MSKYSVFIARCQPYHLAHNELLTEALKQGEKVIVVLGSYMRAPNIKNPWRASERELMIHSSRTAEENARITYVYMRDYLYNDNLWLIDLQQKIDEIAGDIDPREITLVGHVHDHSSGYLNQFPQWNRVEIKNLNQYPHATVIRDLYFTHDAAYKNHVTKPVAEILENFKSTAAFKNLKEEYDYVRDYRVSWEGAPFPPTFVTVDTIVIRSGHVLTVRRKGNPGRGLIALPGGFLNQHEKTQEGALRELKEETGIKLPKEELERSIKDSRVFDHPDRSNRGRTITHAFLLDLKAGPLPQVKGADDADKAWWMPLADFHTREEEFFEDHYHIISYFINKF
jgi:bifunctional NMN adenylyltransferase/nudix hydrolase